MPLEFTDRSIVGFFSFLGTGFSVAAIIDKEDPTGCIVLGVLGLASYLAAFGKYQYARARVAAAPPAGAAAAPPPPVIGVLAPVVVAGASDPSLQETTENSLIIEESLTNDEKNSIGRQLSQGGLFAYDEDKDSKTEKGIEIANDRSTPENSTLMGRERF